MFQTVNYGILHNLFSLRYIDDELEMTKSSVFFQKGTFIIIRPPSCLLKILFILGVSYTLRNIERRYGKLFEIKNYKQENF